MAQLDEGVVLDGELVGGPAGFDFGELQDRAGPSGAVSRVLLAAVALSPMAASMYSMYPAVSNRCSDWSCRWAARPPPGTSSCSSCDGRGEALAVPGLTRRLIAQLTARTNTARSGPAHAERRTPAAPMPRVGRRTDVSAPRLLRGHGPGRADPRAARPGSARIDAPEVHALDTGADDYVTKPFGIAELLARMRAAMRRSGQDGGPDDTTIPGPDDAVVETAAFTIDLATKKVIRCGDELRLTPTEWAILDILVRHRGALVTQRRLLTAVSGPNYRTQTNYLRVYLAQLRQNLEPEPSRPRYLITEPGMGYRFETTLDAPQPRTER